MSSKAHMAEFFLYEFEMRKIILKNERERKGKKE